MLPQRRAIQFHLQLRRIVVDRVRQHHRFAWMFAISIRVSALEYAFREVLHHVLLLLIQFAFVHCADVFSGYVRRVSHYAVSASWRIVTSVLSPHNFHVHSSAHR